MYIKYRKRIRNRGTDREYIEKNWTAIIVFEGGYEFSRNTGTASKREAQRWAKLEAERIRENQLAKRIGKTITFGQLMSNWWVAYARHQRSADTMEQRSRVLYNVIGEDKPIRDIDDDLIEDLIEDLYEGPRGKRTGATVNRYIDILRKAFTIGCKHREWKNKKDYKQQFNNIDWNEVRQQEAEKRNVFVSFNEIRQLMELLPYSTALAVAWTIYTGCRLKETASVTKEKIFPLHRSCEVRTKGKDSRMIMLSKEAIRILHAVMRDPTPRARAWQSRFFNLENRRKRWEAAREKIGRPDLRWHDLRHVNANLLRRHGNKDVTVVQQSLGHSDIETTQRYLNVANEEVIESLDAIPRVLDLDKMQKLKLAPLA